MKKESMQSPREFRGIKEKRKLLGRAAFYGASVLFLKALFTKGSAVRRTYAEAAKKL